MKTKILIAGLALGSVMQVHAQSVSVYGIVDLAVETVNHVGPTNASVVRMPNVTASTPSRIGFRGNEDLGNGMKAFFTLETGFGPETGALNYGGRLFGRQALVGLSTANGTLTLGRQYNMTFHAMLDTDIMGPNSYALSDLDSYLANTRSDNAVGYLGKFGNLSVGATYSLGRDAAGPAGPQATNCPGELAADKQACRQWTAMVKYNEEKFGVSASYDKMNGGPAATGLASSAFSDVRSTLNAYVKFGTLKIAGGVLHRSNTTTPATSFNSNAYYIGALYPLSSAWVLDGQVGYLNVGNSANDATVLAIRTTYMFSPRTSAYITAGQTLNRGVSAVAVSPGLTTVAGADQTGLMVGIRHTF